MATIMGTGEKHFLYHHKIEKCLGLLKNKGRVKTANAREIIPERKHTFIVRISTFAVTCLTINPD